MIDRSMVRIAFRTLGRHKGFTTAVIVAIGLAIALNTTMYSVLDAMLAPYIAARKPENIYAVRYSGDFRHLLGPDVTERALLAGVGQFEAVTGSRWLRRPLVRSSGRTKRLETSVLIVRANYFGFLGTPAVQGRTFRPADEAEALNPLVISDRLAESLFAGESPINRAITLDGVGYSVVGVVTRSAVFGPLYNDAYMLRPASSPPVPITLVRFREHLDPRVVQDRLKVVATRLALAAGESPSETAFQVRAFNTKQFAMSDFQIGLAAAVIAVLLVACANFANLQLARGLARSRELAVHLAVGASQRQLVTYLLLETAILAAAALALGILLTFWGIRIVKATIPPVVSAYMIAPQTSWRMFVFATGAALVSLCLVGLLPALRVARVDPSALLKSGTGARPTREHRRRYGIMVFVQIGLALPVLLGAIVLSRAALPLHDSAFLTLRFGFNPEPLVLADVPVGMARRAADAAAELSARARSVPGAIEAAAFIGAAPVKSTLTVEDAGGDFHEEIVVNWGYQIVSPSYFRAYGRRIVRGRDLQDGELDGDAVIVDRRSATILWKGADPVGRSIKFGDRSANVPWRRVVGVMASPTVEEIREFDFANSDRVGAIARVMSLGDTVSRAMNVVVRVRGDTRAAAVRVDRALLGAASDGQGGGAVALVDGMSIVHASARIPISMARSRQDFIASLFATFAFFGLGLVAIGIHGIIAHSIAEQRLELAIRISLGAAARDVLHAVLREGTVVVLAGVAIGLLLATQVIWWLAPFFNYREEPYNAPLFAGTAMVLVVLAILAAIVPALRATRIAPAEALRHD
jgi:putative ABC transport system permease protein